MNSVSTSTQMPSVKWPSTANFSKGGVRRSWASSSLRNPTPPELHNRDSIPPLIRQIKEDHLDSRKGDQKAEEELHCGAGGIGSKGYPAFARWETDRWDCRWRPGSKSCVRRPRQYWSY